MERLIDADVMVEYLRKQLCDNCHEQEDWCDICDYAYLIDEMKKVPTVDAVEVVRCKDCRFFEDEDEYGNCYCGEWGNITNANGYCHDAERKEDETNLDAEEANKEIRQ